MTNRTYLEEPYRTNFIKLAAYLLELPKDYSSFDMEHYAKVASTGRRLGLDSFLKRGLGCECNTAACALGHSVAVPGLAPPPGSISWFNHSMRVFNTKTGDPVFEWCFGAAWRQQDNTPEGAAIRIACMLRNGHEYCIARNYDFGVVSYYRWWEHDGGKEWFTEVCKEIKW